MTAVKKRNLISLEEYLEGEEYSSVKHEYLGGVVYAMAGATNSHNIIVVNALAALHSRLRGHPCQPFNADTKIRVRLPTHTRFYYPDASVVCRPNPQRDSFQDEPVVIIEVLSRGTRRIDEGEKKDAYLTISSLCVYLLVEQDSPSVVALRRTEQGFVPEIYEGLDAVIPLDEIKTELPLSDLYERIEFMPEPEEDENTP